MNTDCNNFNISNLILLIILYNYVFILNFSENDSSFPVLEVSGINTSHSVEAPITINDTVTLSCNISTENGTGNY